jgi:hypothetical protein
MSEFSAAVNVQILARNFSAPPMWRVQRQFLKGLSHVDCC